jgi:hypothetical protein
MANLGTLNKAWDGAKTLTLDRADDSVLVFNPRLTISMMVQTKVFETFMSKRGELARSSGHLARYLVAHPRSTMGFRFMSLDEPVWDHLPRFHDRIAELLTEAHARQVSGEQPRQVLSFEREAKELWVQTQNKIEPRLRPSGDLGSVRDFASKSMEIAGRVAAILHHFSDQEGSHISRETLECALDIVEWHFDEFISLFGDKDDEPEHVKDVRALGRYLWSRYWKNGHDVAPRNEVRRCGPIRDQGRFESALDELRRDNSIRIEHHNPRTRRGKLWILLNPDIFGRIVDL